MNVLLNALNRTTNWIQRYTWPIL